jgi:glycosyltransferase involved in cell wall biosynthesis
MSAYLIVVPVASYRTGPQHFAVEGPFLEHLILLKEKLGELGKNMVLVAPNMSQQSYEARKQGMIVIDEVQQGIRFCAIFPQDLSVANYWKCLPGIFVELKKEIRNAAVVHAGPSALYYPFEFLTLVIGRYMGKITISITDIDQRETARMNLRTGKWSRKQYLVTRLLHDPWRHLQHLIAAKYFSLVMLKGNEMVQRYGKNRTNVKYILDAAFSQSHVIDAARAQEKIAVLSNSANPVELIYFGRLVEYKGIEHMLHAVHFALNEGANVRLHIIGDGPQRKEIEQSADRLDLGKALVMHGEISFGAALFSKLYAMHVLLAAPLSQDTPRSALDAMASGQSIIAYDTYYYRELAEQGTPISLIPWLDKEAMGRKIVELAADRHNLIVNVSRAIQFASKNIQEIWLERRVDWIRALSISSNRG